VGIITYKDRLIGTQGESNATRQTRSVRKRSFQIKDFKVPDSLSRYSLEGIQRTKLEHLTSGAKEATANMFLGEGDLIY